MEFNLNKSIALLERTPAVLNYLLLDLDDEWTSQNEGEETFSPFDVVGHLLHGEKTDWISRIEIILSGSENKKFEPYDRFAQKHESAGKNLNNLLTEFADLRQKNMAKIKSMNLSEIDFIKTGVHPVFGNVTLKQLLATWTVHDLAHIAQISRVMAKQYIDEVGPWKEYFNILKG